MKKQGVARDISFCMSENKITFITAEAHHQDLLGALAFRSKASWGYSRSFLEQCKSELNVPQNCLEGRLVQMGYYNQELMGFYSFAHKKGAEPDLNFLFLEPRFKGQGLGRALFEDAVQTAIGYGWISFIICSDPHANDFYLHMGAIPVGELDSLSCPGHTLPILRYILPDI